MPTRILIRLSLLAGLVAPLCAFALGVGPIEVRSALNQNFEAEIPLISSNPVELIGLTAQVPRQREFDWAGVERYEFLSKLRFSVQTPPGGPNVLKITSIEPLREPNFTLLLELAWPRGRLLRAFPVQLDPALYANRRLPPPPVMVPPPIAAEPAATAPPVPGLPPAPPVSFEGATSYGPVKSGETLMGIASQVRPSTTINLPEMMAILVAGNSEAFVNGNPNVLRAGSVLKVPTPQALGVRGVPTPPVPDVATAASTESAPTQPQPVEPQPVEPTAQAPVSSPEPAPVPEPSLATTPPPVEPQPLPVPAEPLREIIPQASIPQTEGETSPTPAGATSEVQPAAQPEPPPPVAQPEPAPVRPPPVAKPPVAQPEESGFSWLANPVVWIAIAMIVLAVAAVVLLPLLRRPAKPKQRPVQQPEAITEPQPAPESSAPTTRTQVRESRSVRPRPAVASSATPSVSAEAGAVPAASKPAATPPKPIDELLKDIDFGLGDAPAGRKDTASAQTLETPRLPDTEPPTASVTRTATNPFLSAESASDKAPAQSPQADLPSELRLDNLDFDFGDLGLENTARPKTDLPPLELRPTESGATVNPPPQVLNTFEPMTEPTAPPAPPSLQIEPLSMPPPSRKFEFTDITQELEQPGTPVEPLKLDEALQGIDGSLDLGKMEQQPDSVSTGGGNRETVADYVETKLDLATAYLDMGDQVGARSLLEEALQEGTASQQQQARELLKKLG